MSARFEIVRTAAGRHARYRAGNGQIVWTTEVYARRRAALHAIELIACSKVYLSPFQDHPEIQWHDGELIEIRDVDERTKP